MARTNVADADAVLEAAIRARGYEPVRHFYAMVRPTLDDLPDAPLPAGLEIRDVRSEDMEAIYEAEVEAFRDHWGFAEPDATERDRFFNDPVESDVSLWRVAWDGPQVAGMVRSYIHPEQNERLGQNADGSSTSASGGPGDGAGWPAPSSRPASRCSGNAA